MAATRLIPMHINKGKSLAQCLRDRTDYAQNPEKTEKGELVTSYECDPMTCDEEFLLSKHQYEHITGRRQKNDIIAYQIRQSFKPSEITPEEANAIGQELAMRFTKGRHAFIVATHTDRAHIHNHIIFNSTSLDCTKKFKNFYLSSLALAHLSDLICLEHQLSVIQPKPYSEREKRTDYPHRKTFREEICEAIDAALERKPKDFDELVRFLQEAGYEYKSGKQPALRGKGQQRFIRFRSLGEGYSVEELTAVIAGGAPHKLREHSQPGANAGSRQAHARPDMSFLIDIEEKMRQGKGAGYAQWAKVFNVKQMAKAMLFLRENGVESYEQLAEKAADTAQRRDALLSSVREDEERIQEIAVLRKHVINFAKASDTFKQYKASGYNQEFFEAHRELLTLRRAAKMAFDEYEAVHGKGCRPKVKELNAEYTEILQRKKQNYAEYCQLREDAKKWQTACGIVQKILEEEPEQDRTEERQAENQQNKTNR